jgi:hypothetical protein
MRGTKQLGSRMINDHHEADGHGLNLALSTTADGAGGNVEGNARVLANFSKLLQQEASGMKLIIGELDSFSNPGACDHCQLRALQTAAFLNLYQNRSDLIEAVCYVNAFERLQQEEQGSGWYQGQVMILPNMTIREPPYYVIKMVSEATQRNVVRAAWSGNETVSKQLLQMIATASDDGKTVAVRVVNQGCQDLTLKIVLSHTATIAAHTSSVNGSMLRSRVAPPAGGTCVGHEPAFDRMMNEANTPAHPETVVPEPAHATIGSDGSVSVALPHWSFVTLVVGL